MYGFPAELHEQELWEKSLPNKLSNELKGSDGHIKKPIGVCHKHFPPDCPKKKPGGILVPSMPPSIFGATSPSLFLKMVSKTLREISKRVVSAESRAEKTTAREETLNQVHTFFDMKQYCLKFSPEWFVDISDFESIKIMKFNDNSCC